jgi:hypothetical protein
MAIQKSLSLTQDFIKIIAGRDFSLVLLLFTARALFLEMTSSFLCCPVHIKKTT